MLKLALECHDTYSMKSVNLQRLLLLLPQWRFGAVTPRFIGAH